MRLYKPTQIFKKFILRHWAFKNYFIQFLKSCNSCFLVFLVLFIFEQSYNSPYEGWFHVHVATAFLFFHRPSSSCIHTNDCNGEASKLFYVQLLFWKAKFMIQRRRIKPNSWCIHGLSGYCYCPFILFLFKIH